MAFKHEITHEEVHGQFKFKVIGQEHAKEAIDFFFEVFLKGEPSTVSFGGYKDRPPAIIAQVEDVIRDGVSVMALDTTEGQQERMAGIRLSFTVTRDNAPTKRSSFREYCLEFPRTHAAIMTIMDELMWPGDIFQSRPETSKIYDMFALATHPDYRGRGLATQLVRQALAVAKKAECDCAVVVASSDFSRRIFNNLGMEVVASKNWQDCKMEDEEIFGEVQSECLTSHYLKL